MSRFHSIQAALVAFAAAAVASCSSSTDGGTNVGPPANIAATSATAQGALTSAAVAAKPSVKVTDANNFGVGGVTVTFAVTGGGGTLTGATPVTNDAGIATLGSWTTGPTPGINTVTATVTGLNGSPVTFTANASTVISNFTIQLNYLQTPTTAQRDAFDGAAARWSRVVTGDLTDVASTKPANACGVGDPALNNFLVDDLLIYVSLVAIDGPGKILGQAGPCFIRSSNKLTVIGIMKFDTADLANMETNGTLDDVILHEMGHVLGFGSIWDDPTKNFLATPSSVCNPPPPPPTNPCTVPPPTCDTHFTGTQAISAFNTQNGGNGYTGAKVPVENTCGAGTADSHWRESVFDNELMTGFISGTPNPMSRTTIASLQDLGYIVSFQEADPFTIPAPPPIMASVSRAGINLQNDIRTGPLYLVDDRGRIVGQRIIR
jgi:leishmanolysin